MATFKLGDPDYYRQFPEWFQRAMPGDRQQAGFFLSDPDADGWDEPAVSIMEMPPDYVLFEHAHPTHRVEVVIKGELTMPDGEVLRCGDVFVAGPGEVYGPKVAGPDGCTTAELFATAAGMVKFIADSDDGFREHDLRDGDIPRALVMPERSDPGESPVA